MIQGYKIQGRWWVLSFLILYGLLSFASLEEHQTVTTIFFLLFNKDQIAATAILVFLIGI